MIKANFSAYNSYVTDSLHQWDLDQVLSVTGLNLTVAPEVHFSNANMDRAIVRQATMSNHVANVSIPNSLLQDPLRIYAHIGIYEGTTFKVVELVEIPVVPRKRPADYQIQDSDEEIYSFKRLENAIANLASQAQVASIIAHNNDTEGNTELLDIRTAESGSVHASAGDAVRSQTRAVRLSVGNLADDVFTPDPTLFKNGSWNHDDVTAEGETWKVRSKEALYFPFPVKLRPADGFRVRGYWCDDTGASVDYWNWTTTPFFIPAHQRFKIVIGQVDEDTTKTADVAEFVAALHMWSNLRVELNSLGTDVANIMAEAFTLDPDIFAVGGLESWNNGIFKEGYKYRVATTEIQSFPYAVTVYAAEGFRFAPNLYKDGVFVSDEMWNTEYTFPAGQQFKMMIARATEDDSETADVAEFVAGVYGRSVLKNEHEEIKEDLKKMAFAPPKNKEVYSINHRGYNSVAPENTLPAYKLSKKNGFDFVETDVRWTSDGVPVLLHDATINRTARNADGTTITSTINISQITYAAALSYDFGIYKSDNYKGTKIPTFEEFISLCRNLALHPYIEIEGEITTDRAATLLRIVSDCGLLDDVTWISFAYESLLRIVELYPRARVGINCITTDGLTDNQLAYAEKLKEAGGNVFFNTDTNSIEACVSKSKEVGLPMELWCPNTEAEIINLPTYVSGVTSDKLIAKNVLYNAYID